VAAVLALLLGLVLMLLSRDMCRRRGLGGGKKVRSIRPRSLLTASG